MEEGLDPDQEEEDVALRDASVEIPAAVVVALALSAWELSDNRGRARYQDLTLAPRFVFNSRSRTFAFSQTRDIRGIG